MRLVITSARLLPALCAAGALLAAPESKAAETDLTALVANGLSQLGTAVNGGAPNDATRGVRRHSRSRIVSQGPTSGLSTSSLEADTRLDSAARGLTPSEDWRRIFPQKER